MIKIKLPYISKISCGLAIGYFIFLDLNSDIKCCNFTEVYDVFISFNAPAHLKEGFLDFLFNFIVAKFGYWKLFF